MLGAQSARAPYDEYARQIARLALAGVPVGDKYHTKHHFADVKYLAARMLQCRMVEDVNEHLTGLGIPSNFSLLMDGVPLGGVSLHGRHGSVTVICLIGVSHRTGRLQARFLTWYMPSAGGHGGAASASSFLDALAAEPFFC